MEIAAIVQARMGSERLPGKVLREVEGKPLLAYLLERLARTALLDGVVVATSDDVADDAIASFCRAAGVDCHRGSVEDVAGRILAAVRARGLDAFVRVSGDSPLLDQTLVDRAVTLLVATGGDLATNVYPSRTFPHGQSVEAFRRTAFERGYALATETADFEHVTPVFYRHADQFRISSFTHEPSLGDVHLAVDTEEDLAVFAKIAAAMDRPHGDYNLDAVLELRRACVA
jgi:spore coat polysaccharide biosynthesis protein SpsF